MTRRGVTLAAVLWLIASGWMDRPSSAQRTTFSPRFALRYSFWSNVDFVSEPEAADSSLAAAIVLPVNRDWRTGSLNLQYAANLQKFDEFQDLDHVAHRLSFDVASKPSERSAIDFGLSYRRSQNQGGPLIGEFDEEVDGTFSQRVWRDSLAGNLSFGHSLSRRWRAGIGLSARQESYENVIDDDPSLPPASALDRSEQRVALGLSHSLSEFNSIGARVSYRHIDLDVGGVTDAVSGVLTADRVEAERLSWGLTLGGWVSLEDEDETPEEGQRSGFQGGFRLTRNFRRSNLVFFAGHGLSLGGARFGTSINSDARVSWLDTYHRQWRWGLYGRYGRRDPNGPGAVIDTYEAGGLLHFRLHRRVGMFIGGSYATQSTDLASDVFGDFYRATASLQWSPLGEMEITWGDYF